MKLSLQAFWVALRKESVDRNLLFLFFLLFFGIVALRKESVDRNGFLRGLPKEHLVALRKESVDRNIKKSVGYSAVRLSLSARRAWIEMQ